MSDLRLCVLSSLLLTIGFSAFPEEAASPSRDIYCEGQYGGHLQGIDVDSQDSIYWSFTVDLVKTDAHGKVLAHIEVPNHHGDLVCLEDRLYVAVNLGEFNQEPGKENSWVYVYSTSDLALITKYAVPELVHGAGGITMRGGHFFVVGGLPVGYAVNYVYEYDAEFSFIKRHVLASGYTEKGIQTACAALGRFWFGCYGYPENNGMLVWSLEDGTLEYHDTHASIGIAHLGDGRFLQALTKKDEKTGRYWGKVRPIRFAQDATGRFVKGE